MRLLKLSLLPTIVASLLKQTTIIKNKKLSSEGARTILTRPRSARVLRRGGEVGGKRAGDCTFSDEPALNLGNHTNVIVLEATIMNKEY